MNRIKHGLSIFFIVMLLFSCCVGLAEDTATPEPAVSDEKAQWTVMMYMAGTDLETEGRMASYNLMELAQTKPSDHVNVVFQTGGTRQWHTEEVMDFDVDETKLQRYQFSKEGYKLVDEQPLANMASAQTLTEFIQWGAQNYPAEKYLLLMWDHGGGSLYGLIQDEMHNHSIMPLDQFEIALKNANVPLEAVLLDTCLMSTMETAQAVQASAKYLIAAQEIVPGYGSAYQTWMQFLYDTPTCDGARLGKVVCNSIQQKYAELGMLSSSRQLTFSVIDLSKIDAVAEAFEKLFTEAGSLLADVNQFYTFADQAQQAQHFTYETMVDLADLASRTRNIAISNETASAVIEAVDAAVVYNLKGDQRSYATGISFYYAPAAPYTDLDHYARISKSASYLAFLDAASMQWTAPTWVYEKTERLPDITRENYIVETAVSLTADGQPKLTITNAPASVTQVHTTIYQYEKATDTWLKLGKDADITGDFEKGVFFGRFPGHWLTLNNQFVQVDLVEENENHVLYSIPFQVVIPEQDPLDREFRLGYVFNETEESEETTTTETDEKGVETKQPAELASMPDGTVEFYGVWDQDSADSTQLPSRNVTDLSSYYGFSIQLMRNRIELPVNPLGSVVGEAFELNEDLELGSQDLPSGKYFIKFDVTDVLGNQLQTEEILIDWDGETAIFSGVEVEESEKIEDPAEESEAGTEENAA